MNNTNSAADIFDQYASQYHEKYGNVSKYAKGLNFFLDQMIGDQNSILELGCGPGNLTRYLLDKNTRLNIRASDLSQNMIDIAKKTCPEASFELLDFNNLSEIHESFDAIIAGFCLPYIHKNQLSTFIASVKNLLRKDGYFYLSFIEDNPSNSGWTESSSKTADRMYMNYYQTDDIKNELNQFDFSIEFENLITYRNLEDQKVVDSVIISRVN